MVACVEEDNVFLASAFLKGDGKASGSDDVWYWLVEICIGSFIFEVQYTPDPEIWRLNNNSKPICES